MSLDEATKTQIQQDITEHRVLLYMKGTPESPQCGFSAKVVEILNELADDPPALHQREVRRRL